MFEQFVLALKNSVCPEFNVLNMYFLSFIILNNLRLPWKIEFALKFFAALKYFLSFRIFEKFPLALKTEFSMKIFTALNIVFIFRIFQQLVLALKTECALNSLYWIHRFYHSEFWTTCACPDKHNLPWNFSLHWNIFYLSGFLSNLSLPWKQSLTWNFQARGGGRLVRHWLNCYILQPYTQGCSVELRLCLYCVFASCGLCWRNAECVILPCFNALPDVYAVRNFSILALSAVNLC